MTPLEYLMSVVRDPSVSLSMRVQAAKAALPFCHAKPPAITQKEAQETARKAALAGSRFQPAKAPLKLIHRPQAPTSQPSDKQP